MNRILNEFFRQRANMRVLKQDLIFKIYLVLIRMTDERKKEDLK